MPAQLDDKQIQWLVEVAGVIPVEALGLTVANEIKPLDGKSALDHRQEWAATEENKNKRLESVRKKLNESKSKIRALMDIEVKLKDGTTVKAFSSTSGWNPDEEFDAVHHVHLADEDSLSVGEMERLRVGCEELASLRDKLTGSVRPKDWSKIYEQCITQQRSNEDVSQEWLVSPETIKKVVEQYASLLQKTGASPGDQGFDELLKEQKPVHSDNPLFSDLEIRRELFDPLVREKIIPDNEIEDRFNSTFQGFTGASNEYKLALEEFSDTAEEDPELTQARKLANVSIKSVTKIGSELVGLIGEVSEIDSVKDTAKMASDFLKATESIGLLAVSTIDQFYGKKVEGIVDQVGAALEASLTAAFGKDVASYAKWARIAYSSCVNAKEIGELLVKREQGWVDNALEKIGAGIESAFSIGDNDNATRLGKGIKQAFMLKVNGTKVMDFLNQDPPATELVIATVGKWASSAMKDVLTDPAVAGRLLKGTETPGSDTPSVPTEEELAGIKKQEEEDGDAVEKLSDDINSIATALDDGLNEVTNTMEEANKRVAGFMLDLSNPETLNRLNKAMEDESTERLKQEIELELKAIPKVNAPTEGEDIEKEFIAIQPLIAEVKKSGIYLKLAESLLDAALKTGGNFIPLIKFASSFKDLTKNLLVALEKERQLDDWIQLRKDAIQSASIASTAFASKVRDLRSEYNEANHKYWISYLETGSFAFDPTGITSNVIGKTVSIGGSLLDIVLEYEKAEILSKAWQAYRKALRNPGDRIQLREAIEKNSTLSKYAFAYAALQEGDPIAKAGLAKVGLTEEVLRDPSAKVRDIVEYLESVWSSDPTNMKKIYRPGQWQSDLTGDLTLSAWMSNMDAARGEKLASDKVVKGNSGAVEGVLSELEQAKSALSLVEVEVQDSQRNFIPTESDCEEAVNIYKLSVGLCNNIKQELLAIQSFAKTAKKELSLKELDEDWKDPVKKVDILKSHLTKLVVPNQEKNFVEILERVKDFNLAADKCLTLKISFPDQCDTHTTVLRKLTSARQRVSEALILLQKSTKSISLLRADGKPSEGARMYVQSIGHKSRDELNDLKTVESEKEQAIEEVLSKKREFEVLVSEIENNRQKFVEYQAKTIQFQNEYRQYVRDQEKLWKEATKQAQK